MPLTSVAAAVLHQCERSPVRLFWSSRSPYARKVMVVAHELGIAARIETVPTVVIGRNFSADYAALNPTGYLPALALDDGTVLADSTLICDHLEATYGSGRLLPPDPAARLATLRRLSL